MFWWGLQVLLVNTYLIYNRTCKMNKQKPMSHYEFQKEIGMGCVDPDYYGVEKQTLDTVP